MPKLISLFPHTGDDGKFYDAGSHREVSETELPFLLQKQENIQVYEMFPESPKTPVVEVKAEVLVVEETPVKEVAPVLEDKSKTKKK